LDDDDANRIALSWQDRIPAGGVVVSNETEVTLDIEAILDADRANHSPDLPARSQTSRRHHLRSSESRKATDRSSEFSRTH
jgi:hypothetical protein